MESITLKTPHAAAAQCLRGIITISRLTVSETLGGAKEGVVGDAAEYLRITKAFKLFGQMNSANSTIN